MSQPNSPTLRLLSYLRATLYSILNKLFDILDGNDQPLGTVEQRLLHFLPTFENFSPSSQKLAKAKLNFWGTTYTVTYPIDDHVIATEDYRLISAREPEEALRRLENDQCTDHQKAALLRLVEL